MRAAVRRTCSPSCSEKSFIVPEELLLSWRHIPQAEIVVLICAHVLLSLGSRQTCGSVSSLVSVLHMQRAVAITHEKLYCQRFMLLVVSEPCAIVSGSSERCVKYKSSLVTTVNCH